MYDAVTAISNDTDLVTPIRMATAQRRKPVFIVCPGHWQVAPKLSQAAQLLNVLLGTAISKPAGW